MMDNPDTRLRCGLVKMMIRRSGRLPAASVVMWIGLWAVLGVAMAPGCQREKVIEAPPPPPPVAKFTGPAFLYGTVGSLTAIRGREPMVVDGWGLVVGLHNTGSSDMPDPLRQRMLQVVRRHRMGEAFLDSEQTAVVKVTGLVPPGAVAGMRFDVLVEALENSQTTSLEHGRLFTCDLAIDGANPRMLYSAPQAEARGPIYFDPFSKSDEAREEQPTAMKTRAVVVAGGIVTQARRLSLMLNEPSWAMSDQLADRINQRFRKGPTDRRETAVAKDDRFIELNVPSRYARDPDELVSLIEHLYLQQQGDFVHEQARRLLDVLREQPKYAARISLAWQALGKQVWLVTRPLYEDADRTVRLTALEAGAKLGDMRTVPQLVALAGDSDATLRTGAAKLLAELPGTPDGDRALYKLLDDDDLDVRVAAYEALSANASPALNRTVFREDNGDVKFVLDLVPARRPMMYVAQAGVPRIAIYNARLAFTQPLLAKAWDGEIRLRGGETDQKSLLYYKPFATEAAKTVEIHPFVANLIFLLAHRPTVENPTEGFDLTFSEVADILGELEESGAIKAPLKVEPNRLAQLIEKARSTPEPGPRPEVEQEFNEAERFLQRPQSEDEKGKKAEKAEKAEKVDDGARPE